MSSAGEKQYYALALVQKLMDHLPSDMRVGLLYDIGCQLERSCRKWNFFDEAVLSRFEFAISVFHAYGHQWPCQVIYHPRKREGFGLLDGKGCERLWSSLKPLIAPLRVSGVHDHPLSLFSDLPFPPVSSTPVCPRSSSPPSGCQVINRFRPLAPTPMEALSGTQESC
ncbi:hypothetical protein HYDPIDRAFT_89029 [Hydnomerulius pinastri MD-312]|uniref:Uncharacterized protein n=1 Tax=Hydnomerulius pinastri MD-312 TaxID=994086 RepID=A0A0C9VI13_9AGAM|nr:hypothetical protein HYDPIDRAFT_89029 [Hydnomerulius pinastri MD-312]